MTDDFPPPYRETPAAFDAGEAEGSPEELLAAYAEGADSGTAGAWRIEGTMLVGRGIPLAIRLPGAVLTRHDLPEDLGELTGALADALAGAGLHRVEERTVLGHVVGIEVAGVRGSEWDLWAVDAETGHEALKAQALGELADQIDPEEPARRAREEQTLQEIERDLWS